MISETWYSEIESTIFTYLQHVLVDKEDAPYPKLTCTTSSQNESIEGVGVFPTLYIHLLPPIEIGQTLYNSEVAAIRATFELQTYSDKSEDDCNKIITSCIQEMKKLHFNVTMFPDPQTLNKKYYAIARFTRVIASGDRDLVPQDN